MKVGKRSLGIVHQTLPFLFSSKSCKFRPWNSMYDRKSGAAYSVTGPKYCDGSFRPRKSSSNISRTWNLISEHLTLSFHCRMWNKRIRVPGNRGEIHRANRWYFQLEGLWELLPKKSRKLISTVFWKPISEPAVKPSGSPCSKFLGT